MTFRGRGMALFQKLAELQVADKEEQAVEQQQLDQLETQSTSTDTSETEKSPSEAPPSTESSFVHNTRRRLTEAQMKMVCEMMPALSEKYKGEDYSHLRAMKKTAQHAEETKQHTDEHLGLIAPEKTYKTLREYWQARPQTWKRLGYGDKYEAYATPELILVIAYYRSEISEDLTHYTKRERLVFDAWPALITAHVQSIRKMLQTSKPVTEAMNIDN